MSVPKFKLCPTHGKPPILVYWCCRAANGGRATSPAKQASSRANAEKARAKKSRDRLEKSTDRSESAEGDAPQVNESI